MPSNQIVGRIIDAEYGKAFQAFAEEFLSLPPAARPAYEAAIEASFPGWYCQSWRGW